MNGIWECASFSLATQAPRSTPTPAAVAVPSAAPAAPTTEWFCDVCSYTIPTDEQRWDCRECAAKEWSCCEACFAAGGLASTIAHAAALLADGSEIRHPHPLQKYTGPDHASDAKLPCSGSLEVLRIKPAAEVVAEKGEVEDKGDGQFKERSVS
jgi:hypothetical protein